MTKSILTLFLLLSVTSYAHFKPNKNYFIVSYSKGNKWNPKKDFKHQSNIGSHVIYKKKLFRKKSVLMAGEITNSQMPYLILNTSSFKKAQSIMNSDPAIQSKILKYKIKPFKLTMLKEHH